MIEPLTPREKALLVVLAVFTVVALVNFWISDAHAEPRPGVTATMPELLRKHSPQSVRGYEPSSYRGKWFDKKYEPVRKCIVKRESGGAYMMRGGGAYQFMSYDRWPISLAWMMKKETRHMYGNAEANRMWDVLSRHEVNQWSRYWQDFAFWRVWRHGHGRAHWNPTVPGTGCF